jgi:phage tail sheath gpL-like
MDGSISFNEIPLNIRVPGVYAEFDNSMAVQGLAIDPTRCLVIGPMLPTGTATADTPVRVLSWDHAVNLFGRGSQLAQMFDYFKSANRFTDVWALPVVDDPAGQAATATLIVTGAATASGTVALYVGGERIRAGVSAGATPTQIAASLAAAVNAALDLPVTAAAALGVVTLTFRHKGESGNALDLRLNRRQGETLPAGIAIAIAGFSGGAANPDIAASLAALGDKAYHFWAAAWSDSATVDALHEELTRRWGPLVQLDGHCFIGVNGSHGTLSAFGQSKNTPLLSGVGLSGTPTPPWGIAAQSCAVCAYHLDIDPARPVQTLILPDVVAPDEADRFTLEERNLLLYDGFSTLMIGDDGTVRLERVVTLYRTNAYGLPDPSYLDLETRATLSVLRRTLRARITQKYPRHKLADDGTRFSPGQAVVTPSIMRAELIALFGEWEFRGWVEGLEQFKADLLVVRNADDPNRLDALLPPDVINQLRVFAAQIQFRL